ncbi:hypothetical protein [Mangrovibacterium lignilyticum]|uniref:hypothetical protein n=1 Tax=Mangrovibacterium lignilyticum TaxID=2668052 RepID=UPI0013D8267B|nr:hypothetical protein [Mangrovibacterium lignilyticum]
MKRKVRALLVAICLPVLLCGQSEFDTSNLFDEPSGPPRKAFTLFLSAGHLGINDPYQSTYAGGIKIRMFLGERFSFDSGFLFGKDHGQFGIGTLGIPIWLLGMSFVVEDKETLTEFLLMGALMLMSAEHMAYHIPASSRMTISPYVSFLRFKQLSVYDESVNSDDFQSPVCFSVGLEINNYFKRFVVSPFVDYNIAYSGDARGVNFGINLGYHFPSRR